MNITHCILAYTVHKWLLPDLRYLGIVDKYLNNVYYLDNFLRQRLKPGQ